jgi:hypothetical protein
MTEQPMTPISHETVVVLDADQVEALRHLLGTVEDWLLHCSEEVIDDLAEFLTGLGWAPFASRERRVAHLVDDLGEHAVSLRGALCPTGRYGTGPVL